MSKKQGEKKLNSFSPSSFCNEMEFAPHPSYSNTQPLGHISLPLSPSFIQGSLALTSYCSSEWHAALPGIQFIWAMYDHKPYPLQPGRFSQQGGQERREEEGGDRAKAKLASCQKSPLQCVWNVRGDGGLYLLVCLQIVTACAECSDHWAERA